MRDLLDFDYAHIPKRYWKDLVPDELGAVMSCLATYELRCKRLPIRGRLRRRRLEALALFQCIYWPVTGKLSFEQERLPMPKFSTQFRLKPRWHQRRT